MTEFGSFGVRLLAALTLASGIVAQAGPGSMGSLILPDWQGTEPRPIPIATERLVTQRYLPARLQALYGKEYLPARRVIGALAIRRHEYARATNAAVVRLAISMSASGVKPASMSMTFAQNRGWGHSVLLASTLSVPARSQGEQRWFELPLQRPFVWSRVGAESLCIEWDCLGNNSSTYWREDCVAPDRGGFVAGVHARGWCAGGLILHIPYELIAGQRGKVAFHALTMPRQLLLVVNSFRGPGDIWNGQRLPLRIPMPGCRSGFFELGVGLDSILPVQLDHRGVGRLFDFRIPKQLAGTILHHQVLWVAGGRALRSDGYWKLNIGTGAAANCRELFSSRVSNPSVGQKMYPLGFAPRFRLR